MSATNYRNIKDHLEGEHGRLVRELASFTVSETNEPYNHGLINKRDEAAAQSSELEIQFIKMRRIEKQITEIERALGKIEGGSYGLCDSCGLPIPFSRLEALPQTSYCLDCKGKQAGYG
jgi:RNA polymerase-binding protein DksA